MKIWALGIWDLGLHPQIFTRQKKSPANKAEPKIFQADFHSACQQFVKIHAIPNQYTTRSLRTFPCTASF